jgi:hypothetical protein
MKLKFLPAAAFNNYQSFLPIRGGVATLRIFFLP